GRSLKRSGAEPRTIADVNTGALPGDMPIPTAKIGPREIEAPLAAPAASTAKHDTGAIRTSHKRRGRTVRGCAGGSTLVMAIGTIASASSAEANAKAENPAGPSGCSAIWPAAEAPKFAIW